MMVIARILLPLNLLTRREPSSFLRVGKFIDLPGRQSMVLLDRVGKFIDLPGRWLVLVFGSSSPACSRQKKGGSRHMLTEWPRSCLYDDSR